VEVDVFIEAGAESVNEGDGTDVQACPNSQNSTGVSSVSSNVELTSPPKITTATGCRISLPGASAASSSGVSAKAATSAVISTGVSRSSEPRTIMAWPKARPRTAQVDVVADLEDAVARGNAGQRDEAHHGWPPTGSRPASHIATTLPISASGMLAMMMPASTTDW
jgi:hypothetical protein